jgi:hypothetical protein
MKPGSRIEPLAEEALELTAEVPPRLELDRAALKGDCEKASSAGGPAGTVRRDQIIEFYSR